MFPGPNDLTRAARDPTQLNLLGNEPAPSTPPAVPSAKRYVYAHVTRDTNEIQLPVHTTRQESKQALRWADDADNLKVERCRITTCRRERR